MRLAFWRASRGSAPADKPSAASVAPAAATISTPVIDQPAPSASGDLDLRALRQALMRKRGWIIVPTVLVAVISIATVNVITPRYKSEARILIDGRENIFLRPNGERNDEQRSGLDAEAVTSQVQLLLSRDLASQIIKKNKLAELPEFDPVLGGLSPLKSLMALFGIGRDPFSLTPEERVLDAYFDRYTAYAVDKSRVIVIEFQSRDPELAARVANSIADGYLVLQQAARQDQAKSASQWLSGEIDNLRKKVADAESRVEDFRAKSSLFVGTNNTTLSNQQMGELNTQLNNARALKSDAESKARMIREMLQSGKPIEAADVINSELIRRLSEQRVTLRAQLAEQSSTLLDNHPRIKELKAQLSVLDSQIRDEASKVSRSLDNDSRIAGGRVEGLSASLEQLKKQATSTNGQDVQLRALEREAKAQRDLLESYLAKYREANTRENIDAAPADGRIISRASVSNAPAYPKKLPIVLIATLATLLLSAGTVATGELLRMTTPRLIAPRPEAAFVPASVRAPIAAPAMLHPALSQPISEPPTEISEIAQLAERLRDAGDGARKVTILGTASNESITLTALTLGRLIARHCEGRRGRFIGFVADHVCGLGRSNRAGPGRTDARGGLVLPGHHQGPAVARPPCQRRTSRFGSHAAAIAAGDARNRRTAAGVRSRAAGRRPRLRLACGIADRPGARCGGAGRIDGGRRTHPDERPVEGGGIQRGDDAEPAGAAVGCRRSRPAGGRLSTVTPSFSD